MTYLLRTKIITFFSLFFLFYTSCASAKNTDLTYSEKNISNYFSGIIAINQNNTSQAFEFFKKIQPPQSQHHNFNIQFLRTLVLLEKFNKSFDYVRKLDADKADFAEANILLGLSYYIKNDYLNAEKYFRRLNQSTYNEQNLESYFANFLTVLVKIYQNNKAESLRNLELIPNSLINLKKIQKVFIHCYFDTPSTVALFTDLINNENQAFSRYNFFLVNYLLHKENIAEAQKAIIKGNENFQSNILIRQAHNFVNEQNYQAVKNFFNCKNPKDLMAEFFYIIANLYSTEENYELSNFYLKISLFLNKNFSSNKTLLAENYLYQNNDKSGKKIYKSIKKIGKIYSWHASKRIAYMISANGDDKKAVNYLKKEIKKILNPNYYNYYDLANFLKANGDYKEAIKYYSIVLEKLDKNHYLIPTILDRRGASYERLGLWDKSEKDLKESLRLSPEQPYVLNYLAYSWLEKKKNIDESLKMLKKANELKENDGYIIDSLGWGYYLINNYLEAEKLLRRAVELMPTDPIINDHYGDILWKLEKTIQARYFWKHALNLETTDKEFIDIIRKKLIFGLAQKS